ncbi:ADP-ribosylation factor-like protein 6-interacting protein 4 isoform X1 [Hemiscyllium ocellatum]|uniref:ADP-ribosylation factor-like protein 6-interacting protein 4 isoform X1 n=1 Tax=Hemiscyllium ocellatum TaxID=170820 RepID=UPI0029667F90|nr:ADP-ribosylation factor-like protein 6-interacting protein 4 isoform X1 [Hemiscyllium ocellatum]XP_060699343.1 ADP-ribosylation factor-like protein 6-interacting protein 4 isoform X1 [Hemiscyllium ocellatum]XP_060699344.1 ADP-ribosylation factor-like protein 6-interacting protein 4 isoform X1 [Hemiscyllium ocellatum]
MGRSRSREDLRTRNEHGSRTKVKKKEEKKKRERSSRSPTVSHKRSRSSARGLSTAELTTPGNPIKPKCHSSSSTSSSSLSSGKGKHKKRSHRSKKKKDKDRKRKKKREKEKRKVLPVKPSQEPPGEGRIPSEAVTECLEAEHTEKVVTDEQKTRIQAMRPMTKEEWEARQSVIRRVVDPETGRLRMIKGDGEVLEEIVSRERHKEINKLATMGDGFTFQMRMGLNQK